MNSMKNRDRILEAIDQLRRRKARPDIQRICNYLFRRFSINSAEARSDLQWCVENDIVLKVEYKGNISYRNAAKKFSHMKRNNNNNNHHHHHHHHHNNNNTNNNTNNNSNNENTIDDITTDNNKINRKFTQLLTNAFGELIVQEPDYLEYGVPIDEIINNILSKDSVRYTRKYVSILIEKEVESGNLIKMENNNLLMGPNKDDSNGNHNSKRNNAPTIIQEQQQENEIIDISSKTSTTSPNNSNDNDIDAVNLLLYKQKKKPGPKSGVKKHNSMEKFNENSEENDEKRNEINGNVRVGVRRKRAKKVFDPSDNHIPKKRGRPAGSLNKSTIERQLAKLSDESRPESRSSLNGSGSRGEQQGGVCSVCHLQYNKKGGTSEKMIACRECSNKAHYSCLNGDDMMLRMYPDNTWQCPHCKTCVVCYETSDAGCLVVCSVCADAYHTMCHQPRIHEKIKSTTKWLCINCEMPEELKIHEIQPNFNTTNQKHIEINDHHQQPSSPSISGNTSPSYQSPPLSPTTSPPQLSPQNDGHLTKEECGAISDSQSIKDSDDDNIDPSIPDASNWTYEEVYQYFAQYFPEEAHIFRDQEIDGRSLLLLKRIDVLTNLNLKLGPALKIYRHVVKLQVRRDDPKLYWL